MTRDREPVDYRSGYSWDSHTHQRLQLTKQQLDEVQNKLKERQLLNIVVDTNQVMDQMKTVPVRNGFLAMMEKGIDAIKPVVSLEEEERLRVVSINGFAIQNIKNPSEQVQLEAVKQNSYTVRYIDAPTEKVQLEVINRNVYNFQYIKNPTEKVKLEAVKKYGHLIQGIENPSFEMQLAAVKSDGLAIRFIKKLLDRYHDLSRFVGNFPGNIWSVADDQILFAALEQNGYAIKYLKYQPENIQTIAVKQNSCAIEFIEKPFESVQLIAVKNDGLVIKYIENPSIQVQLEAVKQNGEAIQYIKNPSEQVQFEAKKNKISALSTQKPTMSTSEKTGAITDPPTPSQIEEIHSKLRARTKNIIQLPDEKLNPTKPKPLIFGDGIDINKQKENAIEQLPNDEQIAKIYSKLDSKKNSKKKKEDLAKIAKQAIAQANLKDMEEIKKSRNLIEIHTKRIDELEKTVKEFESHIKETELQMTSIMDQVDILEGGIEEIQERIEQRKFQKVV